METPEAIPDESLFNEYLLGGIEILHEKIIERSKDNMNNLRELLEELNINDESLTKELGIDM